MNVLFLQTADADKYARMLQATSRTVIEYCRRHGHAYESFVGLKRGKWPWQATYNRIVQYHELLARGFSGWGIYMDADAYIHGMEFDVRGYLDGCGAFGAVLMPSMSTDERWDVNAGVTLINFDHPLGRELVERWWGMFAEMSDERLEQSAEWLEYDNDQDFLQRILMTHAHILEAVKLESTDLMNSSHATFIRQHLRSYTPDFDERVSAIVATVQEILGTDGTDRREVAKSVVTGLYRSLLGREPDSDGLIHASALLESSDFEGGIETLSKQIIQSEEFGSLSKSQ